MLPRTIAMRAYIIYGAIITVNWKVQFSLVHVINAEESFGNLAIAMGRGKVEGSQLV